MKQFFEKLFKKKQVEKEVESKISGWDTFLNSATGYKDWQRGFINGYNWAAQTGFQPNFKFIRILTHGGKELSSQGKSHIVDQMIASDVRTKSSIIPVCTVLSDSNIQSIINDCIDNAEHHGWCLTKHEQARLANVSKAHLFPEIIRFLETYEKGESISIRVIYRPPMPKNITTIAPPTIIVAICGGVADVRGNPPEDTSDILWTSAIFKRMKNNPLPDNKAADKDQNDDDDAIEMK